MPIHRAEDAGERNVDRPAGAALRNVDREERKSDDSNNSDDQGEMKIRVQARGPLKFASVPRFIG